MARIGIAFRLFFRALKDRDFAERGRAILELPATPREAPAIGTGKPAAPVDAPNVSPPRRSDALTLLAVLQREGRLVDFLKENIAAYSDAQVGAAVRDVHRDSAAALDRLFGLKPIMTEPEGTDVTVQAGAEAARVRLVGNVAGTPPFRGTLRHAGWEAARIQLPEWSGTAAASNIVAPAEVELR